MSNTYPTYEALPAGATSIDFFRLRWFLKSENRDSLTVLEDATDATSTQESYSPSHPISQCALTCPPVSSITVSVEILDEYAQEWTWNHNMHADHQDAEDGERFDAEGRVEYCCEQDRPGPGPQIKVVAESGFVTIGKYIEVVRPWLRSIDGQLRAACGVIECWPLEPNHDIYLWPSIASPLRIRDTRGRREGNWTFDWALLARLAAGVGRHHRGEVVAQTAGVNSGTPAND